MAAGSKPLILFDLGNVLADLGNPPVAMGLAIGEEAFWDLWLNSTTARAFENGAIDEAGFLRRFPAELGLEEPPDQFRQRFLRWQLVIYPGVAEAISALRNDFDTALLSNTNPLHWNMVRDQDGFEQLFDHIFLSYEIGQSKPGRMVFEHVLDRVDQGPADITFLDDSDANVAAARKLGINATLAFGPDAFALLKT
jgi:putative hydrolase of the HAD superfamily